MGIPVFTRLKVAADRNSRPPLKRWQRTLALEACVARQQPPTRGARVDTQFASGGLYAAPAMSTRTAIGKPDR